MFDVRFIVVSWHPLGLWAGLPEEGAAQPRQLAEAKETVRHTCNNSDICPPYTGARGFHHAFQ